MRLASTTLLYAVLCVTSAPTVSQLVAAVTTTDSLRNDSGLPAATACSDLIATATNSGPVCAGQSAVLFGGSNQSGVSYSWRMLGCCGLGWSSTNQNPTAMPGAGVYELTVTNASGCTATAQTTVALKTVALPSVSPSATSVCGRDTAFVSVTNPSAFTGFAWSVDQGTIVSGQGTPNAEVLFGDGSLVTYARVLVEVHDTISDCDSAGGVQIRLNWRPRVTIDTVAAACPGARLTATGPTLGTSDFSFHWSITNGVITNPSAFPTIEYIPDGGGDAELKLTVYNGQTVACSDTATKVVKIGAAKASVADPDLRTCPGMPVDIPVQLSGIPPFTITWSDGVVQSGITAMATTRTVSPAQLTAYAISSVSDALCTGTGTGTTIVDPTGPRADLSSGDFTTCGPIDLTVSLDGTPPFSVAWSDGFVQDGIMTKTLTRSVTPAEASTYQLSSVSDAYCTGTTGGEATVRVEAGPKIVSQTDRLFVQSGQPATLSLVASGAQLVYDWFQVVDAGQPKYLGRSTVPVFVTPPITESSSFFVEVRGSCGTVRSGIISVSLLGRGRAVFH